MFHMSKQQPWQWMVILCEYTLCALFTSWLLAPGLVQSEAQCRCTRLCFCFTSWSCASDWHWPASVTPAWVMMEPVWRKRYKNKMRKWKSATVSSFPDNKYRQNKPVFFTFITYDWQHKDSFPRMSVLSIQGSPAVGLQHWLMLWGTKTQFLWKGLLLSGQQECHRQGITTVH